MKNKTFKLNKKHNWGLFLSFLNFIGPLNLNIEETKLLIWRFYNKETYDRCAELLGRTKYFKGRILSRQRIEQKIKAILKKLKKRAVTNSYLLEYYNYN
jgi:hypothetical protein